MTNLVKTKIKVSDLRVGMTVEHEGRLMTVGKGDVYKGFCGWAFQGDASKKELTRVQFAVPTAFGTVLR